MNATSADLCHQATTPPESETFDPFEVDDYLLWLIFTNQVPPLEVQ